MVCSRVVLPPVDTAIRLRLAQKRPTTPLELLQHSCVGGYCRKCALLRCKPPEEFPPIRRSISLQELPKHLGPRARLHTSLTLGSGAWEMWQQRVDDAELEVDRLAARVSFRRAEAASQVRKSRIVTDPLPPDVDENGWTERDRKRAETIARDRQAAEMAKIMGSRGSAQDMAKAFENAGNAFDGFSRVPGQ